MQDKTILVVDDDFHLRRLLERNFSKAGAEVCTAASGEEALKQFQLCSPDLVILDIIMPGMDGFETCRMIRQISNAPVIMLTSLHEDEHIVRGLDSGADDFISKPVSIDVLLARARAVLRRSEKEDDQAPSPGYNDGYLEIDLAQHRVCLNSEEVRLTPTEFRLLAYLLENTRRVCSFEQILENVWGWEYRDSIDYVHVYVSHLRGKIEPDPKNPQYIHTIHGVGYRFFTPGD
jgi:DNA-binding response OmpR family regulator